MTGTTERAPARTRVDSAPRLGIGSDDGDDSPRARTGWVRVAVAGFVVLGVASLLGSAFAPTLLHIDGMLLVAVSPQLRHVVLAISSDASRDAILVTAFLRHGAMQAAAFVVGAAYGARAISILRERIGGAPASEVRPRLVQRLARLGPLALLVSTNPLVALAVGAAGGRPAASAACAAIGQVAWLAIGIGVADTFAPALAELVAWIGTHVVLATVLTMTAVALAFVLRSRRYKTRD